MSNKVNTNSIEYSQYTLLLGLIQQFEKTDRIQVYELYNNIIELLTPVKNKDLISVVLSLIYLKASAGFELDKIQLE